jgi:hypothetical protein
MTRDDIIRMAREAGHSPAQIDIVCRFAAVLDDFAALVAAQEREACAFDAEWCIQNHLEHLMPERIRARRQA